MRRAILMMLVTAAAGPAVAADTIRTGYWESTNRILSPIQTTKVERRCITPKDVAKFMMGPSNHIYQCTYPDLAVGDGSIRFAGRCVDKKGHAARVAGAGTYTETTLSLKGTVAFSLLGLPLSAEAATDAHRIGDVCPPGSKGGPPATAASSGEGR